MAKARMAIMAENFIVVVVDWVEVVLVVRWILGETSDTPMSFIRPSAKHNWPRNMGVRW